MRRSSGPSPLLRRIWRRLLSQARPLELGRTPLYLAEMLRTRHKIAVARSIYRLLMAIRRPFGRDEHALVKRKGINWHLNLAEGIDLAIYLTGYFEGRLVASYSRFLKPQQIVVDVGANIGAHTLHFARLVTPGGRVIAFEPTRFAFEKLKANLELNPTLRGVTTLEQGLLVADVELSPELSIGSSWPLAAAPDADSQHGARSMSTDGVTTWTLDGYLGERGIPKVDVLKIDVDGNEWKVIQGARATLERDKPLILMEFAPYLFEPSDFDAMVNTLSSCGYRFLEAESLRPVDSNPSVLRSKIAQGASINVLLSTTAIANTRA